MIAGEALILMKLSAVDLLGKPGVKTGVGPLLVADNTIEPRQSVLLPEQVLGIRGTNFTIAPMLLMLPKDTTYGRRFYKFSDDLNVTLSVILMGHDRSSIHNADGCMFAQDWSENRKERILVRMDRPIPYDLPVKMLTISTIKVTEAGQRYKYSGIYAYWFVSGDEITSELQSAVVWSLIKTLIEKRTIERWAYVSCFCPCLPGQEEAASKRVQEFIKASTPQFQLFPTAPGTQLSAVSPQQH